MKLLRVLQDREVRPVGGKQVVHVDVRFVAATNRDLKELMEKGSFREDLFYRLNVINIHVPPLRERGEDVAALAEHFVEAYGRKLGKPIRGIGDDLAAFLARYHWPGNVRELENLIERAVILAESDIAHRARSSPRRARAVRRPARRVRAGGDAAALGRGIHPGGRAALPGPLQRDRARARARHRPQGALDAAPRSGA